jgi:hypothetical protein
MTKQGISKVFASELLPSPVKSGFRKLEIAESQMVQGFFLLFLERVAEATFARANSSAAQAE